MTGFYVGGTYYSSDSGVGSQAYVNYQQATSIAAKFNNPKVIAKLTQKQAADEISQIAVLTKANQAVALSTTNYNLLKKKATPETKKIVKQQIDNIPKPGTPPKEFSWNLPPHTWSLPLQPQALANFSSETDLSKSKVTGTVTSKTPNEVGRLGRMWFWSATGYTYTQTTGSNTKTGGANATNNRNYGFQFMWNPDNYTIGVSLNTDITPTMQDQWAGAAGVFPSGETINFTLRLDRTNDFAALKNFVTTSTDGKKSTLKPEKVSDAVNYYKTGNKASGESVGQITDKINELLSYGTVADIEYIYRAVNGDGWVNAVGRSTSDVGYLQASLLRIDIGPLSYIGYIMSLSVNHTAFNQDMTPIRSDVSISMNLMSSATLSSYVSKDNSKQVP